MMSWFLLSMARTDSMERYRWALSTPEAEAAGGAEGKKDAASAAPKNKVSEKILRKNVTFMIASSHNGRFEELVKEGRPVSCPINKFP